METNGTLLVLESYWKVGLRSNRSLKAFNGMAIRRRDYYHVAAMLIFQRTRTPGTILAYSFTYASLVPISRIIATIIGSHN